MTTMDIVATPVPAVQVYGQYEVAGDLGTWHAGRLCRGVWLLPEGAVAGRILCENGTEILDPAMDEDGLIWAAAGWEQGIIRAL